MNPSRLHQLALTQIPGIGNALIKSLVSYSGSAEAVFTTPKGKLEKIPGVGKLISESILKHGKEALEKAEVILKRSEKENIQLLFYTDKEYPTRLKQVFDAPAILYVKGKLPDNNKKHIAIVGTRQATKEGKQNVETFVQELAPYKPVIISGLAYGIDIEAHKAALKYGLPTYAVMATGMDIIYPSLHKKIATEMQETGGLLTEYPLDTKADPARFPARNRIIAGLSDATLVVEAGAKGGALITARLAQDYDREVFAIPGNLTNKFSEGCNYLIRNNVAQLVTSANDIAYFMGWEAKEEENQKPSKLTLKKEDVSDDEWSIIQLLKDKELHIDELSWKSQIQVSKLATLLLNLEFENIVVSLPGKKFKLR
ncbi:MAG: DNA-processing protein DprA [Cyclobacteriaceae bacterium]|nr:DNA-processing protein DprA [Cyclobacteriaceae bacterium]